MADVTNVPPEFIKSVDKYPEYQIAGQQLRVPSEEGGDKNTQLSLQQKRALAFQTNIKYLKV